MKMNNTIFVKNNNNNNVYFYFKKTNARRRIYRAQSNRCYYLGQSIAEKALILSMF